MSEEIVTLYRPIGPEERDLLACSEFRRWPARLLEQPFFYPVANEEYAWEIARNWNVPQKGAGFVTRFRVRKSFMKRYPLRQVGGKRHQEWWIPAAELEELNDNVVGIIEIIGEFR